MSARHQLQLRSGLATVAAGAESGGDTHDLTLGFSYNAASQIVSNTRSNDVYAFTGQGGNSTTSSPANGLNQLVSHGGAALSHDARGNLLKDPHTGYTLGYSSENRLASVNGGAWNGTIRYDPLGRLYESGVSGKNRSVYDGHDRVAEYDQSGTLLGRFVHGPGVDEPLMEYSGNSANPARFLHADERGTIIAASDGSGNVTAIGKFDEYGKQQSFASNRFGFTGLPYETMSELYYARARMLNPRIGRFMQPDPIGYGMNDYAYAGGDPVN